MPRKMREMVGGCCVCSDESGWDENPLVYCDGQGCNVAVHQACYGIVTVPTGPWFCRKCESQERSARVRCELCPNKDGALKRTDTNSWAHVVCALYIPEVRFGNVATMEPIVLGLVPADRYLKTCYLCEQQGRESRASTGACMPCNRAGCKQTFHVTCAQGAGLLCEEAGNYMDNVRYCGYCEYHYQRINKKIIKTIPAFKPQPSTVAHHSSDEEANAASTASATSPSKSPKENSGASGMNSVSGGSSQGRNSSMSTSSSSSKKGKKGRRTNNQGVPSSTTGSPKSDTEKSGQSLPPPSSLPPASPASTSSSLILKRSQSDDIVDSNKKASEDNLSSSSSSSSKASSEKETGNKLSSTSGSVTGSSGVTISSNVEKNNDVSSSSAEINEKQPEKKPPSVIVKFGKQDGTYYSKKQDNISTSASKKEKNHKHSENSGTNNVSISTIAISKRETKDVASSSSTNSNSSSNNSSSNNSVSITASSKESNNSERKMSAVDTTSASAKQLQQQKGFTRANFTESTVTQSSSVSATIFTPADEAKKDDYSVTADVTEKVKSEPMDVSDSSLKKGSVAVSISGSTSSSNHNNSKSSSSSPPVKTSTCSVTLDKSKVDLKMSEPAVKTSNNTNNSGLTPSHPSYPGFGRVGGGKVGLDRQSVAAPPPQPPTDKSASMPAPTTKDSPAKIIPLLPSSVTVTSSNYVKVELKSGSSSSIGGTSSPSGAGKRPSSTSAAEILSSSPPSAMDTSSHRTASEERRALSPSRITTELLGHNNDVKSGLGGPKRTATGKRLGRPPKKGTHLPSDSLGPMAGSSSSSGAAEKHDRDSSQTSPERGSSSSGDVKRRKQSPGASRLSNGTDSIWMMGATLNPNSSVAKEMDACLKDEIQTHSAYDPSLRTTYHGVPFPGSVAKKNANKSGSSTSSQVGSEASAKGPQPQTLEELLERQWEQGSQFLMEQASHFDIASLLSSLHQLKEENLELEDSVDRLVQRRDHLLAVRARLMALSSLSTTSPQNSTQTTPERPAPPPASSQHTNGPSPASGRSSAHVSPRNSAATVSPIRVDRSSTSAATIISPRNLPPPPPTGGSLMSPRDRPNPSSGASNLPPPSHHLQQHQLPSPRDRVPGGGMPPMENGIDFHPPVSQQHAGGFISSSSQQQQNMQNRAQIFANSRGGNLLTVVSSANSGMHSGSSSAQQHNHGGSPSMAHHRPMGHHIPGPPSSGGHGPSPHSPHVQTPPPPTSSGQTPQPPPRQSAYPNSTMHGSSLQPPPSHVSSRPGVHMGHPSHGLPPPPGGMMRPPMSHHHDLRPPSFPGGYHPMSNAPRGAPPHGPPPSHGPPRPSAANMMAMAQHMRSSNVLDKR